MNTWNVRGYRTIRIAASDDYTVEMQDSGPCEIYIPHRGWHTVSVYLTGPVAVRVAASDYRGTHTLRAGDVQLLPGSRHHRCCWDAPLRAIHVHLSPASLGDHALEYRPRIRCNELLELGSHFFDSARRSASPEAIERTIDSLRHVLRLHWCSGEPSAPLRIGRARFDDIHRRMRGPAVIESQLPVLAEHTGLSERQFRHVFRAIYGTSPKRFLLRHRVEHAKVLIHQGGARLTDIALEAGFYDQAHFGRVFKAQVGETPSDYARALERL